MILPDKKYTYNFLTQIDINICKILEKNNKPSTKFIVVVIGYSHQQIIVHDSPTIGIFKELCLETPIYY
jgi:hypothetical protein